MGNVSLRPRAAFIMVRVCAAFIMVRVCAAFIMVHVCVRLHSIQLHSVLQDKAVICDINLIRHVLLPKLI